jgi:hypothetical protein
MPFSLGFWAAAGAGGGGGADAFQLISTQILGSDQTSITFSSIPGTFRHLQIRAVSRSTTGSSNTDFDLRLNGVTTSSYNPHELKAQNTTVSSAYYNSTTSAYLGYVPGTGETANFFGGHIIDILDYSQTTKNKVIRSLSGNQASNAIVRTVVLASANFNSTSAITSVTLASASFGNGFTTGSRFSLYGWN